MKENGFIPLTTIGLIILIISGTFIGYLRWNDHRQEMDYIHNSNESSLMCKISNKKQNLKQNFNQILYDALWKVGKQAYAYENGGIENSVEKIANLKLKKRLSTLILNESKGKIGPKISLKSNQGKLKIEESEHGYSSGEVLLPLGSSISGKLIDNSFSVSLPIEKIKFSNDTRFYLLKDKMGQFKDEFGEVGKMWKYAEYAIAYSEIWLNNKLSLNKEKSKTLFQLALASKELEKFGSFDYYASIRDLVSVPIAKIIRDIEPQTVIKPIRKKEIQDIKNEIEKSISKTRKTEEAIRKSASEFEKISISKLEEKIERSRKRMLNLRKDFDKISAEKAKVEFEDIYRDLKNNFDYPNNRIKNADVKIGEAKSALKRTEVFFHSALEKAKELSKDNPLLKQLYRDLTKEKNIPSVLTQIEYGIKNTLENINEIRGKIRKLERNFQGNEQFLNNSFEELESLFDKALNENNNLSAEKLLLIFSIKIRELSEKFIKDKKDSFKSAERTTNELKNFVKKQTKEPDPNWKKEYRDYSEIKDGNYETKIAKKYVIHEGKGTLGGVKEILVNLKSHLEKLENLEKKFKEKRKDFEKLNLDKRIKTVIKKNLNHHIPQELTREELYRISPPKPVKAEPGISVYHDINIKSIEYSREDPVGLIKESSPPTPIYLWFINTTLYWAQFKLELELEGSPIEEIFDYKNQVIPRPLTENSRNFIHKPLPYKQKIEKKKFEFRLIALSLRPFHISCN